MDFRSTRWTTVLQAGQLGTPGAEQALAKLCEDYRPPIYQFARMTLKSPEEADDLTQSFFYHFIKNNVAGKVTRRGRFRTYLLACFRNFLRDEWRRRRRAAQIPPELMVATGHAEDEGPVAEPSIAPVLDSQLDILWADSIRRRVIRSLEKEYGERQRARVFTSLADFLNGDGERRPYTQVAAEAGISKESVKVEVMRLRERFRGHFRDEVAQTVGNQAEFDAEVRYLLSLLFSTTESGASPLRRTGG